MEGPRVQTREQQRERGRQRAVGEEARSAERALKEQDVQHVTMSQVRCPSVPSVRKDYSPIKVCALRILSLVSELRVGS